MNIYNNVLHRREFLIGAGLTAILGSWLLEQNPEIPGLPGFSRVQEIPSMNLPYLLRTWNYGSGSCVHASMINCLLWQGQDELAAYWRKSYQSGESYAGLTAKLEKAGLLWAGTYNGDVGFIEWACRTRRGAVIFYYPNHSVNLVHIDKDFAYLLDNNRPKDYIKINRLEFIHNWKGYGGVAVTPVCSPAPPLPWTKQWIEKASSYLQL